MTSRSHASGSSFPALAAAGRLAPWLGVAALSAWAARPVGLLLTAAAGAFLWVVLRDPHGSRWRAAGALGLLGGILLGFSGHREVAEVASDFEAYWTRQEALVGSRLSRALEDRLAGAEAATAALAAMAADSVPSAAGPIVRLRRQFGITALALYGPEGELLAWDGTHRGLVPEEVQRGLRRYAYGDLPLFGYLYVTAPTAVGGTAVAAVLLRADLPGPLALQAGDFASEFRRSFGEPIRLVQRSGEARGAGWDWTLGDRTLFTVVLDPPRLQDRADGILGRWRILVGGSAVLAWAFFYLAGPARLAVGGAAAATLLLLAGLLPFQRFPGLAPLFDTSVFALPGPAQASLGRVAALALALVTVVGVLPSPRRRLSPVVAGLTAGGAFPLVLGWLKAGASAQALAGGRVQWVVFQGTAAILLTLVAGLVLTSTREGVGSPRRAAWGLALVGAVGLGAGTAGWVRVVGEVPFWWPALWLFPVALAAASESVVERWRTPLASWVLAGVLAGTASIPAAWADRVEARREIAAAHLARLAAPEDPEVEEALHLLGEAATALSAGGEEGVDLLYGAWRQSGLAELGAPTWLTLWSAAGIPEEELRVGVAERPVVAYEVQEDPGPPGGTSLVRYGRDDARYVLRVTLEGGQILTAAAPPFADPASRAGLSPLLGGGSQEPPVTLVPLAAWEGTKQGVRWARWAEGWRAELPLVFSNALYRAHYSVALPGTLLATARATLLLVANLMTFLLLRAVGRSFFRERGSPSLRWSGLVVSFRARVTLALFGFFVLAVALFGTLAYRTIEGTSGRAAEVLAERVAEDAAGWYVEVSGRMQALSRRVGVELLEYRRGELRDGSVEELVELGLYEAWLPMSTHRVLEGGEDVRGFAAAELGTWSYVSAFRRLPDGDVLAAQVPRQAGATALRSADVAELLAFAVLLGAALSLALALLVGQALTRPIQALQVASERVGAGNLDLRLPSDRSDEFGSVFRAFNRMVERLRRTRRQLVRTTRRTQAIMEEAAVGMVALDPAGRVTLVNPRAEDLLGQRVAVGEPLPAVGRHGQELAGWIEAFLRSTREESDVEHQAGERRVRVRARRLGTPGARGGAVVALEDVTDELRTERVLAWGEMARQVAHEVKNPLTPMKLSVQHIRRAWEDRRSDFEAILLRNADAILEEIDRLAAIAKSFSRFGAPADAGGLPLESVDVSHVVREMLALYRGSEGPVAFEERVPEGLPRARARVSEMKEVLVNLLENARVASPLGGVVRVEASLGEGGTLVLKVVDTGRGISEAFKARVFEPQFSTRSTGAGLGLAIVRRLVESWGGTVGLESREGEGTRVVLSLRTWPEEHDARG